jgi:hypothetical protein
MPKKGILTKEQLDLLKFVNASAYSILILLHENGKEIETEESLFSDPGEDYTEFKVDGKVIYRIDGY